MPGSNNVGVEEMICVQKERNLCVEGMPWCGLPRTRPGSAGTKLYVSMSYGGSRFLVCECSRIRPRARGRGGVKGDTS